jgi:hypothetical protein
VKGKLRDSDSDEYTDDGHGHQQFNQAEGFDGTEPFRSFQGRYGTAHHSFDGAQHFSDAS